MKRTALALFGLGLAACGGGDRNLVAVESNGDADIRIVLVSSSLGQKTATALTRDEAFRLPIKEVARGNATLRIAVVAYDRARLEAAFPALAGLELSAIRDELHPELAAPAAGAYLPPAPLRVLSAELTEDSEGDVPYTDAGFDGLLADAELRFVFRLSAGRACAPGTGALRLFARDAVKDACSFERSESCTWEPKGTCEHLGEIFRRDLGSNPRFREVPGRLLVESAGLTCPRITDTARLYLGESSAFSCPDEQGGTRVVSIQETPRIDGQTPWVTTRAPTSPLTLTAQRPFATRGKGGTLFAFERAGTGISLELYQIDSGGTGTPKPLRSSATQEIALSRMNGEHVMGISAFPQGTSLAITTDQRALVFGRIDAAGQDAFMDTYYRVLNATLAVPPDARGPLTVGSGARLYWPISTGLALYRAENDGVTKTAETPAGEVTLPGDAPVKTAVVRSGTDGLSIVVWTETNDLFLFAPSGEVLLSGCRVEGGKILSALPGPRLLVRRAPFVLGIYDVSRLGPTGCPDLAPQQEIFVPPLEAAGADAVLLVDETSYIADYQPETVLFRYGAFGGFLDVSSGLSQISALTNAPMGSILVKGNSSSETWALFPHDVGTGADLLRVPTQPPRLER